MKPKAVVFDIYGTLIDIKTDEKDLSTYERMSHFLSKYEFTIDAESLRENYFSIQKSFMNDKKESYGFKYPEVRIVDVFKEILVNKCDHPKTCYAETIDDLSMTLPLLFRQLTIRRKRLLPHVTPTLEELNNRGFQLSIISNAQSMIAIPELNEFQLMQYFHPIIISSDYGVKKPENILFKQYIRKMKIKPDEVLFVGNDMRDDIYGAQQVGFKTVFVDTPIGLDDYKDVKPDVYTKRMDEILEHLD